MSTLKTREPTGRPSWPLILLAGEAKTGKTYRACELTADERVGRSFFLDLGEGCADEYVAVPGAKYQIIDHDGTWVDIIGQVEAVREVAREELAGGRKPVVLIVDSMTAEWAMLSAWTDLRARRSKSNRATLARDPDAEIDITSNYWNDATSRHNRLMNILKTFPGVVVMTALETEKTQFGPGGVPIPNAPKVAKPEGQKRLSADATVWVRLSLTEEPVVVGIRSLRRSIIPGKDRPEPWADFTVAALVFDVLGLRPEVAQVRNTPTLTADQAVPGEHPDAEVVRVFRGRILESRDADALKAVWDEISKADVGGVATTDGGGEPTTLKQLVTDRLNNIREHKLRADSARDAGAAVAQPASQDKMRRIFALLDERGIGEDSRHAAASMALERDVASFTDLTAVDADRFIARLEHPDAEPDGGGGDR